MIRNYIKIAFRNLKKTKLFSIVNILGLAIGITACLMILHYVNFEKSYDRFHENSDRIYRIRYERTDSEGQSVRFASCCPPASPIIGERFPEVENIGRVLDYQAIVSRGDVKFLEEKMYFAEPGFLEIFDFNVIKGDRSQGLAEPNHIYISESFADKYFGGEDPVGQSLNMNGKTDYEVVGIFKDVPENSHIKFDALLSFINIANHYGPDVMDAWGHTGFYTYALMKPDADMDKFKSGLADLVEEYFGEALKYYNLTCQLPLQPLTDIHLNSNYMQEHEVNGNRESVNFLLIVAMFIIIMAWVNYINLSTSRAFDRAKEVGLRKVVGASRKQIIMQFLFETVMINVLSIVLALGLLEFSLPLFSKITGAPAAYSVWSQVWFYQAIGLLFISGILFSGLYPIIAMSSFKPTSILRGKVVNPTGRFSLRKALLVFQFVIAFALITCTLVVYNQISFMRSQDTGFNIDQVMVVKAPRVRGDDFEEKIGTYKKEVTGHANIQNVSFITETPGRQIKWDAGGIFKVGDDQGSGQNYQIMGVDYDFMKVFDTELVHGRFFSKEFQREDSCLILNETAVKWMGFESPEDAVGRQVSYWGQLFDVVGVMKNYHQQSLKENFEPTLFRYMPAGRGRFALFTVKINPADIKSSIATLKKTYEGLFPGNPFDYYFLDEYFNQQYKADELFGKVFGIFAFLAIFITCLGIFALSYLTAYQRTKEIGIRKVLGASVSQVLSLLSKDFMVLAIVAFVVAIPLSYYGIDYWLKSFAVRMDIGMFLFIIPMAIVVVMTMLTMSSHVYKAAVSDPMKSLRYE